MRAGFNNISSYIPHSMPPLEEAKVEKVSTSEGPRRGSVPKTLRFGRILRRRARRTFSLPHRNERWGHARSDSGIPAAASALRRR
jgi:hypothetical protein